MKKIIYTGLIFFASFSISCNDFLETESPSKQSNENVFNSRPMAEGALMGVYSSMTTTYVYGQKLTVNWQGITDIENCNLYMNNYNDNMSDYGPNHYYNNSANRTTRWNELFRFAELASSAVDGLRKGKYINDDPKHAKSLLGEALTLRSLAYYEIVKLYGDIPYKEGVSNSDLSNVYIGKVDRDVVYADIVKDLQEAIDYLPWLGESNAPTVERVTKGFAKGLLARISLSAGGWSLRDGNMFPEMNTEHHPTIPEQGGYYVGRVKNWKEYYNIAMEQCAEMLGDDKNPHKLDMDYENIWKSVNHLDKNSSNENLFEIAFGVGQNGDIGTLMGWEVQGGSMYGLQGMGSSYATSTMYYFYSFHKADKRRDVTLTFGRWNKENFEELTFNAVNVHFAKWRMYWMSEAYKALHLTAQGRVATGVNWILMRNSDIYLMFAEAMNELNGPDQQNTTAKMSARNALEKVRARAFGEGSAAITDYDSNFFNAIVNERAWEFGCEGIRKQDLVRWGLLSEKIEAMKEALCLMIDNQHSVKIFDKTYQPSDFPEVVYYKRKTDLYVDFSNPNYPNYYTNIGSAPAGYEKVDWFPKAYKKPETGTATSYRDTPAMILVMASGINPSYDYSSLLGKMKNGTEIDNILRSYPIGNNTCYYRHHFAIYYEDIYQSKGKLVNSYNY
ncbi:MAG: RagB/SusD family nutrient uptake outer membrane protein [Dysgonomonas sp.]